LVVGNLLNTSTNGTYFLTLSVGQTIDFYANLDIAADASQGIPVSVADYSHTLHIFIDVPDGFTFLADTITRKQCRCGPRAIHLGNDDPRLRWHWLYGISAEERDGAERHVSDPFMTSEGRLRAVFLFGGSGINARRRHQA
jgi:hypothetical protein